MESRASQAVNFIKLFALVAFKLCPLRVRIIYIYHRVVSFESLIGYSTASNKKKPWTPKGPRLVVDGLCGFYLASSFASGRKRRFPCPRP